MDSSWKVYARANPQGLIPDFFGEFAANDEVIRSFIIIFAQRTSRGAFHPSFLEIFSSEDTFVSHSPAEHVYFWNEDFLPQEFPDRRIGSSKGDSMNLLVTFSRGIIS